MTYNFTELTVEEVNIIFKCLNKGTHEEVRPLIDKLFNQVKTQEQAEADKAKKEEPKK